MKIKITTVMQKYFNKPEHTFQFKIQNRAWLDVEFLFDLEIEGNIKAFVIKGQNITAWNLEGLEIYALNVKCTGLNFNVVNLISLDSRIKKIGTQNEGRI